MFEIFSTDPEKFKKKLESLSEGVHKYAHDFDPEKIHMWCETDPELDSAYKKFLIASETYADYVCAMDDLVKEGKDMNEIFAKQAEAHTNSEFLLKTFIDSAHKKGYLQDLSNEKIQRPQTAQIALFSAFANAYEQTKKITGEAKKAG